MEQTITVKSHVKKRTPRGPGKPKMWQVDGWNTGGDESRKFTMTGPDEYDCHMMAKMMISSGVWSRAYVYKQKHTTKHTTGDVIKYEYWSPNTGSSVHGVGENINDELPGGCFRGYSGPYRSYGPVTE
jgi:hypothetical protein